MEDISSTKLQDGGSGTADDIAEATNKDEVKPISRSPADKAKAIPELAKRHRLFMPMSTTLLRSGLVRVLRFLQLAELPPDTNSVDWHSSPQSFSKEKIPCIGTYTIAAEHAEVPATYVLTVDTRS